MRKQFCEDKVWSKIQKLNETEDTPFLVIDLNKIEVKYKEMKNRYQYGKIYYAVKANPHEEVLKLLIELDSCFDIASIYELDKVLKLGASPDKISYGNTIKKAKDIKYAYEKGVRLFATDSETDLRNIAKAAPGARVFVRILTESSHTADWPLSRKFGCHTDLAVDLVVLAQKLDLVPYGISFHVGSQQNDIGAWDAAIAKVKYIYDHLLNDNNIKLSMINMGGGLPAQYSDRINTLETYSSEITRFLQEDFGDDIPEIILEPGRSLVAEAGVIVSEIVLISRKSRTAIDRWVYTDVGKFNGLIETSEESIRYPIYMDKQGECERVVLAGPTCDSMDIMYENNKYDLPLNASVGDKLYWFSTGAYTASYCSVEFNGFPPLRTIIL